MKCYKFKNQTEESADLYVYGTITSDKTEGWFSCESDVDLNDFKEALDNMNINSTLNMYVNSPGGSVFAASTMVSMLRRAKATKNLNIKAYVDGLAASAASFLIMVADEIIMYANSMLMVHKPLSTVWGGNANDFEKEIDVLNSIEDNVMIPLYMEKAKCDEEKIKELINIESWLSAKEVDNFFNVTLLEEQKDCAASIDKELFKHYKNVPKALYEAKLQNQQPEVVDYSYYEKKMEGLKI